MTPYACRSWSRTDQEWCVHITQFVTKMNDIVNLPAGQKCVHLRKDACGDWGVHFDHDYCIQPAAKIGTAERTTWKLNRIASFVSMHIIHFQYSLFPRAKHNQYTLRTTHIRWDCMCQAVGMVKNWLFFFSFDFLKISIEPKTVRFRTDSDTRAKVYAQTCWWELLSAVQIALFSYFYFCSNRFE